MPEPMPEEPVLWPAEAAEATAPAQPTAPMPVPPPPAPMPPGGPRPQPYGPGRCPRCGGEDLTRGLLLTYDSRFRPAYYKPGRLSFFRLNSLLRPFKRLAQVEALACRQCGMVLFQVDPAQLNRIEPPARK
jgi:hypothetical protein